jgi:hypothetical protein
MWTGLSVFRQRIELGPPLQIYVCYKHYHLCQIVRLPLGPLARSSLYGIWAATSGLMLMPNFVQIRPAVLEL